MFAMHSFFRNNLKKIKFVFKFFSVLKNVRKVPKSISESERAFVSL